MTSCIINIRIWDHCIVLFSTVELVGPEEPCTIDYASANAQICQLPETCLLCSDGVEGFCSGEASGMATCMGTFVPGMCRFQEH